jgi:hypothetical protein
MVAVQLSSAHVEEIEEGHLVPTDSQAELELHESSLLLQIGDPAADEFKPLAKQLHNVWLSQLASRISNHTSSLLHHHLNWLHQRKASLLQLQLMRSDGESIILLPLAIGSVLVALSLLVCLLASTRDDTHGSWNAACHPGPLAPWAVGGQQGRKRDSRPPQFGSAPPLRSASMLPETKPQVCMKTPESEASDYTSYFGQAADSGVYLPGRSARSSLGGGGAWVHVEYVVPQDSECCLHLPSLRSAVLERGYAATGGFNEEVLFKVGLRAEGSKETFYVWSGTGEVLARSVPQLEGGGGWRYAIVDAQGRSHGVVSQDNHVDDRDRSTHRFVLSEAGDSRRDRMVMRGNLQSEVAVYDLAGSLIAHFMAPSGGAGPYRVYLPQGSDVCLLVLFILSTERLANVSSGCRF